MNKVSLRIADLRKKAKVTQQELADSIGVSFQTLERWLCPLPYFTGLED